MPFNYKVKDGDCIESIAYRHGFLPDTLWNHQDNADLKHDREDPNLLMPGDIVVVPDLQSGLESAATEQRHRFSRKAVPSTVGFQILHCRKPVSDARYLLTIDGITTEGQTDSEGKIESAIPPDAKEAVLHVFEEEEDGEIEELVYEFVLGGLNPYDDLTGHQARLENLGFPCDPDEIGEMGDGTRAAVMEFQRKFELKVTGELDDTTCDKLKHLHEG